MKLDAAGRSADRASGIICGLYTAPTAMQRFRQIKTRRKFASVHANIEAHFNPERHLIDRQTYREQGSAALAE